MAETPNSYKDPFWSNLASAAEEKFELPKGVLVSILTNGERSNNDQVSEAGAKTPFQIIPSTQKAAIKKYGIDPYLSADNAAEVAALLMKDSLDRNKGNVGAAVAEYHGGTNRENWGPRTRAYAARVIAGLPKVEKPQEGAVSQAAGTESAGSTFDRVLAAQPKPNEAISKIYEAYRSGAMSPEEKTDFEADVKNGLVMLPRGAKLDVKGTSEKPEPILLPQSVTEAYVNNKMSEQERSELEADMKAGIVKLPPSIVSRIPTDGRPAPTEQGIIEQAPEPTIMQNIVGTGEAALNTVTGMTGGAVGMAGGTVKGAVDAIASGNFGTPAGVKQIEQTAAKGAEALTYQPRTEAGKNIVENVVAPVMQAVLPVAGVAHTMPPVAVKPAVTAGIDAVKSGVEATKEAVKTGAAKVAEAVKNTADSNETATAGTKGSAGSAGTDKATQRRMQAKELPVEIDLTKGQAERTFEQIRFEREAAKDPVLGKELRDRYDLHNKQVEQNLDAFIDQTGAQEPTLRGAGAAVDKALRDAAAADKQKIRIAYKDAEKAGEMASPVPTDNIVGILNENTSAKSTAGILGVAEKELMRLGGASEVDGALVPGKLSLGDMEQLRKLLNKNAGNDATNIKYAAELKAAIDKATENAGGDLYKNARKMRARFAENYENHAVIADVLRMKRGTNDRAVSLEKIVDRTILDPSRSLDDVRQVRRVLHRSGPAGEQAWRELQAKVLEYIKEESFSNSATNTKGDIIVSPAKMNRVINSLEHQGKLDFVFGKKGGEQLRLLNDISKDLFTSPPGAINYSNTASVLLAALDGGVIASTGVPVPVATGLRMLAKHVKDAKLKKRIAEALNTKF